MSWNRPKKAWQWLFLFSPAFELMGIPFVADRWGDFLLPHDEIPGLTLLIYNLFVALALCVALGVWQAWQYPRWSDRIATGLAFGIAIAIANGVIAFGGCSVGDLVFQTL